MLRNMWALLANAQDARTGDKLGKQIRLPTLQHMQTSYVTKISTALVILNNQSIIASNAFFRRRYSIIAFKFKEDLSLFLAQIKCHIPQQQRRRHNQAHKEQSFTLRREIKMQNSTLCCRCVKNRLDETGSLAAITIRSLSERTKRDSFLINACI